MTNETHSTPPSPAIRLPTLKYVGQTIRRVSHEGEEMICLKDVLNVCGYSSQKNCSLYYQRADSTQIKSLPHRDSKVRMVFATTTGVTQMVERMWKPEALEFSRWFAAFSDVGDHHVLIEQHADTTDLRETLTALKLDILERAQALHEMRVEAATLEAALKAAPSALPDTQRTPL